jgi:hypothetical protein
MAKHSKHAPDVLADALEHIVYEMWKYKQSIADFEKIRAAGSDAAIEFRVLHHRVLLEFFYAPPKHEDNIVAWEYIANWSQTHDRALLPWFGDYVNRCHTMLAHISKSRTDLKRRGLKDWASSFKEVEPHIDQTIADFLAALSGEHKAICRNWVSCWLNGPYPANAVLSELALMVR